MDKAKLIEPGIYGRSYGGNGMGLFINCLAVVCSTVIAICGISYFMREKNAGSLRYYMLIMGFFGALWSGGYGIMGFTETAEQAVIFRAVGLVGIVGFLMTEALMVVYMIQLPKWLFRAYAAVFGIFAAVDLFFSYLIVIPLCG